MVAPVNDFDTRLQAQSPRTLAPRGGVILSTTANVVTVNGSGVGTPSIITLVASPLVVTGSLVWTTSPTVPLSIDTSGKIATLNFSDMGTSSVQVTVTLTSNGLTYTDSKTVSQVTIGSLGYQGALDATRNNTAQGLLSARPVGANGDIYFATDNLTLYQKLNGGWQIAGNNFTNTNQLTDGANLGGTAAWTGVSGTGKPADNASSDILLSGTNVTIVGNLVTKTAGAVSTWDAQAYSIDSFTGGAFASVSVVSASHVAMFGLNSLADLTDAGYTTLDYAIYLAAGSLTVYESAANAGSFGTYAAGDVLAVAYDGSSVKYLKNGTVFYTSTRPGASVPNQTLFFDSSIKDLNSALKNVRFGPLSSNNWASIGGSGKPEDGANFTPLSKGHAINVDPAIEKPSTWSYDSGSIITIATGAGAGAVGDRYFRSVSSVNSRVRDSSKYAIDPTKTYSLTANLYQDGTSDRNMYIFVNFYDASGAQVSSGSWGGAMSGYTFSAIPPSGWSRQGSQFGAGVSGKPIPPTARTCDIGVWFNYTNGTSTTAVQGAQDLRLEPVIGTALLDATVNGVLTNFNNSNDRNGAAAVAPTILSDGTAVDHTIRTDGAADISFEWSWSGNEGDIDGFLVYVYQSSSSAAYSFGTTPAAETAYTVPANKRAFILFGAAANLYTTFGVQAYRSVDKDVNPAGAVKSLLVKPSLAAENPYRPSANVAFTGDITGTVNGIAATSVNVWSSISGAGKPSDNATSNLTLVGRNVTVTGNTLVKTGGTNGAWDADAYSPYGYTGGAFASAVATSSTSRVMIGLDTNPTQDSSYTSIDYAVYMYIDGTIIVYESGVNRGVFGTYTTGDVLMVSYDGVAIRYSKNGAVFRTVTVDIIGALYFDSSFFTTGHSLTGAQFGPLSSSNWNAVGGAGKPEDGATVGANAGNLNVTIGGDNLLTNSGFEVRSTATAFLPNGWRVYNNAGSNTLVDVAGRTGGKAYGVKSNAAGAYTLGVNTNTLAVDNGIQGGVFGGWKAGETYVVSFKAKKVNGAAFTTCALRWNTAPTTTVAIFNPILTTSWQTYAFRITMGATVESNGNLYIDRIGNLAINDEFHIDEVMVQESDVFSEWFVSSREASTMATGILLNPDGTLAGPGGSQGAATLPGMGFNTFRVITRGSSQTTTLPATAGFYVNGELNTTVLLRRSYNVVVLSRVDGSIVSAKSYDVYGAGAQLYDGVARTAATLAADLNALSSDKIVVVISADEPKTKRMDSGLDTAMYRCGASRAIFGSPNFKSRSAYALVGIPGIGEGGGAEAYQGSVDNDTNAWIDMGFNISSGVLSGVSSNFTPKTLTDYGYTGDLDATKGATLGTNVGGQITSGNASTLIASQAIGSLQISDLRTSNYAEDASANPTAGAKIASTGTAFKVAKDSFQVGTLVFSDYWFRIVQGIDGSIGSNRLIWRGNNDATTRGGAPNINCLTVYPRPGFSVVEGQDSTGSDYGTSFIFHSFALTPTAYNSATDNLDAMTQIHAQFFLETNSTDFFTELYLPCPSRTYDGAAGVARSSWAWGHRYALNSSITYPWLPATSTSGITGYRHYVRVRVANTYGWSATKDFGPPSSPNSLDFTQPLPVVTITGVAGSAGGGGGSSGGSCPAPWVKVRLINGTEVDAASLHNGARLAAVNDSTLEALPQGGVVRDLVTIWAQRYRVKLTNGQATEWSENHRFATADRGWVAVQHLRGGDQILGLDECVVESVLAVGEGQVVSFRVEGAGTYFAGGLLCHNAKVIT